LIAQDALSRGFGAVVFRVRNPVRVLKAGEKHLLRLILNHRPRPESAAGHFTVVVRVDGEHVVLHDPQTGPNRRVLISDLLNLWRPIGSLSEIAGNVLVALGQRARTWHTLLQCGTTIPEKIACPKCQKEIPLHPTAVLGA